MSNTTSFLARLGLSPNESQVYEILNRHGSLSVGELCKLSNLARTTVNENIDRLKNKGLVFVTFDGKNKMYMAENPKKLESILAEKQMQISKEKNILESLTVDMSSVVKALESQRTGSSNQLDIRYYKGRDEIARVYDEILAHEWVKSYANFEQLMVHFPENHQKFTNAVANGTRVWDLFAFSNRKVTLIDDYIDTANQKVDERTYMYKFFPENFAFQQMDYLITEDSVTIVTSGNIPEAIVIVSSIVAANAEATYDLLWGFL